MNDETERTITAEEIVQAMPTGAVLAWHYPQAKSSVAREVAVILKIPLRKTEWKDGKVGYGRMEIHTLIPEGPIIRFLFQTFPAGVKYADLTMDAFLNPADPDARAMLTCLTRMDTIDIFAFGEHNQRLGMKRMPWRVAQRNGAQTLLDKTANIPVMWPQAVERFKQEHPV